MNLAPRSRSAISDLPCCTEAFVSACRPSWRQGETLTKGDLEGHARGFLRVILALAPIEEGDVDSALDLA